MTEPEAPIAPRVRVTLSWDNGSGLVVRELLASEMPRTFGRLSDDEITDPTVSREHFEIQSPDGLRWRVAAYASENALRIRRAGKQGDLKVDGKAMLDHGDCLHAGNTVFLFKIDGVLGPAGRNVTTIVLGDTFDLRGILTPKQSGVVEALCRPARARTAPWAGNAEIAEQLVLEVPTIRKHLQEIYARLHREPFPAFAPDVPYPVKRGLLVELGLAAGYGA